MKDKTVNNYIIRFARYIFCAPSHFGRKISDSITPAALLPFPPLCIQLQKLGKIIQVPRLIRQIVPQFCPISLTTYSGHQTITDW